MAFTYITGSDSVALDKIQNVSPTGEEILGLITGGNTQDSLATKELARVMTALRVDMPRVFGTPIPVEETVVKFAEGDTQTASTEYLTKFSSFKTKITNGYTVDVYDVSDKDVRNSTSEKLMNKMLDKTRKAVGAYQNAYLPYSILSDLFTGATFLDTIPAKDTGTIEGFASGKFGIARGEKYDNYLLPTATSNTRNHFLTIEGNANTPLASRDVQRAVKLLKETLHYGLGGGDQTGVLVLGNPFTIQNLSNIYNDTQNKDKGIFGETISMYDAFFKGIEGFHDDILVFIDMSYENRLLAHGVNEQIDQRGFGFYGKRDLTSFETYEDLRGEKLFIFEEENYFVNKLSVVVMDVNPTRANTGGIMDVASETVLNNWILAMRATYKSMR